MDCAILENALPVVSAALKCLLVEYSLPRFFSDRARIVLAVLDPGGCLKTACRVTGSARNTVRKWWRRFCGFACRLEVRHCDFDFIYAGLKMCLRDADRIGAPDRYSAKQECEIVALALKKPEEFKRPITHWTTAELADEVRRQDIAPAISDRTVGRLLEKLDIKPYRFAYWLNPKIEDPVMAVSFHAITFYN
jgi:putative transposase